jgi:hypothetical protein
MISFGVKSKENGAHVSVKDIAEIMDQAT